jgi:multidrug efflux pump subunit AcrA (membrane-fusion protein)
VQQQVQLRYYTVAAPTAGVIGDVPVRVGNQVTPQTVLTTIDQNETLELYVSVPIERAGELKVGLPIRVLSGDAKEALATTTVNFISPHVDDRRSRFWSRRWCATRTATCDRRSSSARVVWKTSQVWSSR